MIPLCSRQYLQVKIVKVQLWSDTATEKKPKKDRVKLAASSCSYCGYIQEKYCSWSALYSTRRAAALIVRKR